MYGCVTRWKLFHILPEVAEANVVVEHRLQDHGVEVARKAGEEGAVGAPKNGVVGGNDGARQGIGDENHQHRPIDGAGGGGGVLVGNRVGRRLSGVGAAQLSRDGGGWKEEKA